VLDVPLGVDTETATLAWLISALEHARTQGQTRLLMCLGAVLDDVLFEMESAARRHALSATPSVGLD
jgi:hypothetical protein